MVATNAPLALGSVIALLFVALFAISVFRSR
jgi:hypothetical protein